MLTPESITKEIITNVNRTSALWQQFGFIGDVIVVEGDNDKAEYIHNVPVEYAIDTYCKDKAHYFVVTLEYGHVNVTAMLHWAADEFKNDEIDVVYAVTSHCFDLSVFEIFYTLITGKKIKLLQNALAIGAHLNRDKNILINTVPSSMKVIQLGNNIQKEFGYKMKIKDLYDMPNIQHLAALINEEQNTNSEEVVDRIII